MVNDEIAAKILQPFCGRNPVFGGEIVPPMTFKPKSFAAFTTALIVSGWASKGQEDVKKLI